MARHPNIDGDGQGDLQGHGGEQRAVQVYQIESYRLWQHFGRMTRYASATGIASAMPSSKSPSLGLPATGLACGWASQNCPHCW